MKNILKTYVQPSFLICVAILATAAASKKAAIEYLGWVLTKEALPLKQQLDLMDKSKLKPYEVTFESKIENKDVVEQLGTEDYMQWELCDTDESKRSPVKYCSLFITYYTGNPDQVPHVPDECYTGAGNKLCSNQMVKLNVDFPDKSNGNSVSKELGAKYLAFENKGSDLAGSGVEYSVLYFFHTNGRYTGNRNETRETLGKNLLGRYSYFSKVEWKFYGRNFGGAIFPDKEQAVKASEKLLSVLLPVMEEDHWPDWEEANTK